MYHSDFSVQLCVAVSPQQSPACICARVCVCGRVMVFMCQPMWPSLLRCSLSSACASHCVATFSTIIRAHFAFWMVDYVLRSELSKKFVYIWHIWCGRVLSSTGRGPIDNVLSLAVTCVVRRSCDIECCLRIWLLISCADWHLTVDWCYHGDWLLTVDWLLLEVVLGIAHMQVKCPTFCVIVSHVHWLLYTICIRALQLLYIWC